MKFNLFLKKQYFLIVILISCKTDSSNNSVVDEIAVFEDKGISIYSDNDPLNDVMMQAFWWDSFNDNLISNYSSYYEYLINLVVELSNAHIDLLWLPPSSEGVGMGYHPRKLFDFNSSHGNKIQLEKLLSKLKNRKMHGMADLVFNHRVGTSTWTDFTEPYWSCNSICVDDEASTNPDAFGTKPCGDQDEGWSWGGARDLNHRSEEVQGGLKNYLELLKGLGFDSWRYDYVKGFPAKYVAEYNESTSKYFSVGEFWDGDSQKVKNWIDLTSLNLNNIKVERSAAFDFPLKYKLKEAIVDNNFEVLNASFLGNESNYNTKSITFIDNHDTGCINRDDCDNLFSSKKNEIFLGYVYILTHPGIPMIWIYHYLHLDPLGEIKKGLNRLIDLRKKNKINAKSKIDVLDTKNGDSGYYVAVVDNKLLVKIGYGSYQPSSEWGINYSGDGFTIWDK